MLKCDAADWDHSHRVWHFNRCRTLFRFADMGCCAISFLKSSFIFVKREEK